MSYSPGSGIRAALGAIDAEKWQRSLLLFLILGILLLIPLRIIGYGYMPPDDALRHTAFAVDTRDWGDIILLDPRFRNDLDGQPGWHAFLRLVHGATGWQPDMLLALSVVMAFVTFAVGGLIASGNPPAWFLACAVMSVIEPGLFGKLSLGRPLFFSMAAVAMLLFVWTRPRPLPARAEAAAIFSVLAVDIVMHSSAWYLWAIAVPPLMVCGRWKSLAIFVGGLAAAIGAACAVNGWYNTLATPIHGLLSGFLADSTFGTNLVGELQPSGGPFIGLLAVLVALVAKRPRGSALRDELFRVDLSFMVLAWTLGLFVGRFWVEWGLPAMAVWFTRQIGSELGVTLKGLPRVRDTALAFGIAAAAFYIGRTADVGGRYTNPLRNPLLVAPVEDIAAEMPEEGGVLYTLDMGAFYAIYHRIPHLKFKFVMAMEAGVMPPEDLKVVRAIQTNGLLRDYKPWFDKMTPRDRVLIHGAKPEWEGIEFKSYYGRWIGRKIVKEYQHAE